MQYNIPVFQYIHFDMKVLSNGLRAHVLCHAILLNTSSYASYLRAAIIYGYKF